MIGYSVGGGYDVYARLIARHLGKHIPGNPIVTPKNMDGAGSLRLANWLYNVAPKDGLVFGTIGRGTGFDPLLGSKAAQFDGTKFNWIGSANDEVSVCVVWNGRTKITKFDDLARNDEQRQILKLIFARQALGRPYLAPPGVPQDRVDALRKAFMDTMKDKDFLAEADKAQLEITPIDGANVQKLVAEVYRT